MNLEDLLPTVDRLRAKGHRVPGGRVLGLFGGKDLLTADRVAREEVAAVLVGCRAIVRTRKESDREIGPSRAARMFRGEPPLPYGEQPQNLEVLLGELPPTDCTRCAPVGKRQMQPGLRTCEECSGTGRVAGSDEGLGMIGGAAGLVVSAVVEAIGTVCPSCGGHKVVACTTCEGTGQSMRARVGLVTDTPTAFAYVYVPSLSAALEAKLEEALRAAQPPECLRFDPVEAGSDFAGFAFGDRLELARAAILRAVGDGQILGGRIDVFAWPLLVIKSDDGRSETVAYLDTTGKLRTLS